MRESFCPVLGSKRVGRVGALVLQQNLAVGPAFSFFADEVVRGNLNIIEVNLVHLVFAIKQDDGLHRDARRLACQ